MDTLKKTWEFDRVFKAGRSLSCKELVLYGLKTRRPLNRVGFCVSKKLGKAVERNRLRRRLREILRLHQQEANTGWDLIVLARGGACETGYVRLELAFTELGRRLGLYPATQSTQLPC